MNKSVLVALGTILILASATLANAEVTVKVQVDDSLFVTYEFKNLDPAVYDQAYSGFTAERIPQTIVANLEKANQTVRWGLGSFKFDNTTHTILDSFFLGGTSIVSFTLNATTLRRIYEVKTEWRKFKVNLTDDYPVDFAQRLAEPVAEWQKLNATAFYYESKETNAPDILFYLVLPASAIAVRAQLDSVLYEAQPYLEDQLLDSPFIILAALVIALIIILVYRKAR